MIYRMALFVTTRADHEELKKLCDEKGIKWDINEDGEFSMEIKPSNPYGIVAYPGI